MNDEQFIINEIHAVPLITVQDDRRQNTNFVLSRTKTFSGILRSCAVCRGFTLLHNEGAGISFYFGKSFVTIQSDVINDKVVKIVTLAWVLSFLLSSIQFAVCSAYIMLLVK